MRHALYNILIAKETKRLRRCFHGIENEILNEFVLFIMKVFYKELNLS